MIASEPLAAWLGNREAQARSQAAIEGFVDEWSRGALLSGLDRQLKALPARTPQAIFAVARPFLDQLESIEGLVSALVERSRADPFFMPPLAPVSGEFQTALLLYHRPDVSIAFGVSSIEMVAGKKAAPKRPPGSVIFTGFHTLFRYVKSGEAILSLWDLPRTSGPFSAPAAPRCRRIGRRALRDGDEVVIDGARESFIVDHASSDFVYFQVIVRAGAAPLTVEYDAATCRFMGATGTDEAGARVQMMSTLLREMGREDAVPWLRAQLATSDFHIRWHLMRELLALDAEAVLPDLRVMATHDPHPEVRAAAAQTLRLFFDEEPANDLEQAERVACRA